jgi:hypothetical protein
MDRLKTSYETVLPLVSQREGFEALFQHSVNRSTRE